MLLLKISQTPNIPSVHQRQQMQRAQSLPVPVEIRQHQECILGAVACIPHNHIFLLGATLKNVKYPVQMSLLTLGLHKRAHVLAVNLGRLGDHAKLLI
jgi:hypothetical protein